MKKLLLTLLFLPLVGFSQNIEAYLTFTNITKGGAIDDPNISTRVGDEIQMELNLKAVTAAELETLNNGQFKYLTLDIGFNNNSFTSTGHKDFPQVNALNDTNPFAESYDFEDQRFVSSRDITVLQSRHIDWSQNGGYVSDEKYSVVRIAVQLSNKNISEMFNGTTAVAVYIERFIIQEGADLDPDAEFTINLGTMQRLDGGYISDFDPGDFTQGSTDNATYNISEYLSPSTAPLTTLQYVLNDNLNPTDFEAIVMEMSDTNSTTVVTETGYPLDADGKVQIADLEIEKTYTAWLRPINTDYIPNIHTITDAYRSFKGLNDKGVNGNQSILDPWEEFTADLNLNGTFDSVDVWGLLGYVLGLDVNAEVSENFCVPEQENGEWFHGCTSVTKYELYTVEYLTGYFNEGGPDWQPFFTVTDESVTHNFAYWHHGDLDFSHSTPYPINNGGGKGRFFSNKPVAVTSIDMVSRVEGDKVILELNHTGRDFVGMQARIDFDTSILEFENIEYATGSTAMNFTKNVNNELLIGALIKEGDANIEKGRIFRLEFKTKSNVTNTTGLFYFKNTDAVQKDGNKLELNIQ